MGAEDHTAPTMRLLLVFLLVLISISFISSKRKPKGSKPKGKPVRPTILNKPNPIIFKKYTKKPRGGRCWWDMTRTDCASARKEEYSVDILCTTFALKIHQERDAQGLPITSTPCLREDILVTGTIPINDVHGVLRVPSNVVQGKMKSSTQIPRLEALV